MGHKARNTSAVRLIGLWEEYVNSTEHPGIEGFADWVKSREALPAFSPELEEYFDKNTEQNSYSHRSSEASYLLWRLSKFVRFYTKPVLAMNGLVSQDDFAILAHVQYRKTCSKKEAIEANVIESTTGMEITRRLVKQGLLSESAGEVDKRMRLISLTEKGSQLLYQIYGGFQQIQDVLADMNVQERDVLINFLKRLDEFHTNNHKALRKGNR